MNRNGRPRLFNATKKTSPSTMTGVAKELLVASEFAKNGYEIFLPAATYSGIDIIATSGDVIELIEVKSGRFVKNNVLTWQRQGNYRATMLAIVTRDHKIYYYPK